jgi:glycine cleavage system H protein
MAKFEPITAKRFTVEHESVSFDENTGIGTVSITDYAQSSLGDVVFVELPALGTKVTQGGMCSVMR